MSLRDGTLRHLTRVSGAPLLCMDSVNQIKDLDRISPEEREAFGEALL